MTLSESQWHMVSAAEEIVEIDGKIVGVVIDGDEVLF